jgi:hypothetical protein
MRFLALLSFTLLFGLTGLHAQVKIGDNPQTIDAASVLELESTNKVLVITKMTTAQMEAILPQAGGMVYNTDSACIHYYTGNKWVNLCDVAGFTLTNEAIENIASTINIVTTPEGYNLEVAQNSIRSENIVDGGINGDDIQDNSIGESKLGADAVGPSEIRDNAVGTAAIEDQSILPEDMATAPPGQILATDVNGVVQWQDALDLQSVNIDPQTLEGSGTVDSPLALALVVQQAIEGNTANLDEHLLDDGDLEIGNESLTAGIVEGTDLVLTETGTDTRIDLSFFDNPGTDAQQLTLEPGNLLTLEDGGTPIDLSVFENTDAQQLGIEDNVITLTNGGSIPLPPGTVDTDEQDLSLDGTTINITDGVGVDLEPLIETVVGDNGYLSAEIDGSTSNEQITDITLTAANVLEITEGGIVISEDLSSLAGGGTGTTELADQITITGDGTFGNEFTVGTIGTGEIANGAILLEDINQNGAIDGQIIKWDAAANGGLGGWVLTEDRTDGTGIPALTEATILIGDATNLPQERTITGDATIDNTGVLSIAEDAIDGDNILDGSITTDDLEDDSVTADKLAVGADGEVLTTVGTEVVWAPIDAAARDLGTDDLTQDDEDRIYNFGPNALTFIGTGTVGISADPLFNALAALHVDGTTLSNGFSSASPLGFYFNGQTQTGLHFDENNQDLVSLTSENVRALTVTTETGTTNVLIPERLQLNGFLADNTNANGTAGQVLTATGTGVEWQDNVGGGTIVSADANNAIIASIVDGGAFFDDTALLTAITLNTTAITTKEDSDNKSNDGTLADNSANDFPTEQAVKTYVDTQIAGVTGGSNMANTDLALIAERTHDLAGFNFILEGTGNVGIGNFNGPGLPAGPADKLDVNGQIRTRRGFAANPGTVDEPSYGFYTDGDTDTGMFRSGPDGIGISVGGQEALRMEEAAGNTNVIVFESLELNNLLLDKDGDTGNAGQILSSTGTQTDWIDAPTGGVVYNAGVGLTLNGTDFDVDDLVGDVTGPTNATVIADNAVTSVKIADASILAEDINQNGAADGEVLKWNAANTAWEPATDAGGTVYAAGVGLTLNGTDFDVDDLVGDVTGPTTSTVIADNAITSVKIADASILAEDINQNGADDGEVLKWNAANTAWEPAADAGGVNYLPGDGLSLLGDTFNVDDLSGEVTGPTTATVIADNAITSVKIADASILAEDINQNGAADGEVLKWNAANTAWEPAADAGGVNYLPGDGLSLLGDTFNVDDLSGEVTGPTTATVIADNAITSANIEDASITGADLADSSVETGEILNETILNQDISPTAAIDGSKINPVFTADVTTSGNISGVNVTATGTITATGDISTTSDVIGANIPDYVFQRYFLGTSTLNPNYDFSSLREVKAFIQKNHHLPGVQSAQQIRAQGFWNLGEASRINLEKIEELFLHTLEQEKKLESLQAENEALAQKMKALEAQMQALMDQLNPKQ